MFESMASVYPLLSGGIPFWPNARSSPNGCLAHRIVMWPAEVPENLGPQKLLQTKNVKSKTGKPRDPPDLQADSPVTPRD